MKSSHRKIWLITALWLAGCGATDAPTPQADGWGGADGAASDGAAADAEPGDSLTTEDDAGSGPDAGVADAAGIGGSEDALDSSDSSGTSGTPDSSGTSDSSDTSPPSDAPARYPGGVVHSPVTAAVAQQLKTIWANDDTLKPDVFMKVGASSTVSSKTLYCFAGDKVALDTHWPLKPTLDFFLNGDAAGKTPFDRKTLAAISGKTAKWAMSGSPSPVSKEFTALSPSMAIVHYGTNDMGMGSTYLTAMYPYYGAMRSMLTWMTTSGVVPILTGISPRKDSAKANRWVATYNALIRGLAQRYQVPFIDLWEATKGLPKHGMAADGLHLNGYPGGACQLTPEGLKYGYNVRNLIVLQALDRLRSVLVLNKPGLDPDQAPDQGDGSAAAPWQIAALPFADNRDTAVDGAPGIDVYTGCGSDADESGPEVWYRLVLTEDTALRAVVVDEAGVDVDVHLLDSSASAAGCLARGHRAVSGTVKAGVYYLTVDSFVSKGKAAAGDYALVVVRCDVGDPDCAKKLN